LSAAVETLRSEVSAADRDLDLVMRGVVDFFGVLGVGRSASFTVERGTDLRVFDLPLLVGVGVD
jgi:hypothetical protein